MKKTIYIILILILIGIIAGVKLYSEMMHIATYKSPDGKYELIVKSARNPFVSTMPGDGGSSIPVKVVLKNVNGKVIGKSSSNDNCGTLLFSIEVIWDIENDEVSYAKARSINLKTGKLGC